MIGYSATKAGLIGMVKALRKEYSEDDITINALAPAVIRTAFLDTQPAEVISYMTEKIPMRRTGTILECAPTAGMDGLPRMLIHHRVHLRPLRRPGNLLRNSAEGTSDKE